MTVVLLDPTDLIVVLEVFSHLDLMDGGHLEIYSVCHEPCAYEGSLLFSIIFF